MLKNTFITHELQLAKNLVLVTCTTLIQWRTETTVCVGRGGWRGRGAGGGRISKEEGVIGDSSTAFLLYYPTQFYWSIYRPFQTHVSFF